MATEEQAEQLASECASLTAAAADLAAQTADALAAAIAKCEEYDACIEEMQGESAATATRPAEVPTEDAKRAFRQREGRRKRVSLMKAATAALELVKMACVRV